MSDRSICIRFTSFTDAAKHSISIKEKDPGSVIILGDDQSFDSPADDEYFHILFITSVPQTKAIADLLLWRNFLVDFVDISKQNKNIQSEFLCNIPVKEGYILRLSLRILDNPPVLLKHDSFLSLPTPKPPKRRYSKITTNSSIQGHLMQRKQFNHPVHCAICNRFIWGIHHQGYECSRCSLVTHRKCHQHIPFWCRKSPHCENLYLVENRLFEFHIPHVFKHHEAPLVRALIASDHGYCNHCGSQVIRKALKCTNCCFIIHEHCAENVPHMCTVKYSSVVGELQNNFFKIVKPNDPSTSLTEKDDDNFSDSSSYNLDWINPPLSKEESIPLPKFSDFEYIGRLGNGGYGKVYCVQHINSKRYVAMKVVDGLDQSARQQLEAEKQILCRYTQGSPYMIKAYCAFHQGSELFLAMELVVGDTLKDKLGKNRMNEDEIRVYLAEIISVLQYLHSNNIIYRDLKLEHVIVCPEGNIRLIDYGLGKFLKTPDQVCHTICGTPGYTAPEVLRLEIDGLQEGYSYPVDFWAVGIILLQMLCGEQVDYHPKISSDKDDEGDHLSNLTQDLNKLVHISQEAHACITGLLEIDSKKRLGSPNSPHGSIRDHPFFKVRGKINWEDIDEGLFKCIHIYTKPAIMRTASDESINTPLPNLVLDRQVSSKADWIAAGESTCTSAEEEVFKVFDHIDQSAWFELNQSELL